MKEIIDNLFIVESYLEGVCDSYACKKGCSQKFDQLKNKNKPNESTLFWDHLEYINSLTNGLVDIVVQKTGEDINSVRDEFRAHYLNGNIK